jgi:hypothetical protein
MNVRPRAAQPPPAKIVAIASLSSSIAVLSTVAHPGHASNARRASS